MGNHATKASKDKKDVILHQIKPNMVSKTSADIKCMSVNRCPFSKQVKNYQDGLSHQDTLHHRAVKVNTFMSPSH